MEAEKTVLIVDDEPNLLRSLALVLRQAGYLAVTAANAGEALRCLEQGRFGLVLLDLKLPDISGIDLYDQIRDHWPAAAILILTATTLTDQVLAGLAGPAPIVLQKPVDPPLLLERVGELLAQSPHYKRERNPWGMERLVRRGPLLLNLATRQVSLDNHYLSISHCAFNFLLALVRNAPEPMTYQDLTREALDCQLDPDEAVKQARLAISELRRALEPDPQHPVLLRNLRGVGYYLALAAETPSEPTGAAGSARTSAFSTGRLPARPFSGLKRGCASKT